MGGFSLSLPRRTRQRPSYVIDLGRPAPSAVTGDCAGPGIDTVMIRWRVLGLGVGLEAELTV
jgi:hypothetical protein